MIPCVALTFVLERDFKSGYRIVLNHHANLVKEVIEDSYQNGLPPPNPDRLCYHLSTSINARVRLLDTQNRVIGDSMRGADDQTGMPISAARLQRKSCRVCHPEVWSSGEMNIFIPISVKGNTVARASVSTSLFAAKQAAARTRRIVMVTLIAAALLAIAVSQKLAFSISKSISSISSAAKKMSEGDLTQRASVESTDEIGQLATSFNGMAGQIEKMLSDIEEDRSKMETILTTMADGIIATDSNRTIVLFNKAAEEMLGKNADDVIGRKIEEPGFQSDLVDMLLETLKTLNLVRKELRPSLPDGKSLSAYSSPMTEDDSKITGAIIVLHDLTEMREHERAQREFVANVSHELRTPITAVRVTAEALLSGAKDDPQLLLKFLKTLVKESDRLAMLIDDLLEIVKREGGRRPLRIAEVDLYEIAERVFSIQKAKALSNQLELSLDIPDIVFNADSQQVEQILSNLLDNAINYTPSGGSVTISAAEDDTFVSISVSDTGIGIPPSEVPRIFDRFYRVDKARSRQAGGTGLGLSIVRDIVDAHSGTITVQTKPGKGSKFTVVLPKEPSQKSEDPPSSPKSSSSA
jgi:two-component system, OmpR family, phosphate regulon sensor histidine kinase PhoR